MNTNIKGMATGVAMVMALAPIMASADTVSDLQAQIQTLMGQLKTLQTQLWQAKASSTGTTTPWGGPRWENASSTMPLPPGQIGCPEMKRELKRGMRGDDVKGMQQFLQQHPESGFSGSPTGFFGEATEKAMKKMKGMMGLGHDSDMRSMMKDCMKERREDRKEGREGGMGMMGGMAAGTVQSVGTNSFVVVMGMGSTTRTVTTNASTTFEVLTTGTSTPTTGTFANITSGVVVMVRGEQQSDGSVLAKNVRILPAGTQIPMPPMMGGMGGKMGEMMGKMKGMMGRPDGDRGGDR